MLMLFYFPIAASDKWLLEPMSGRRRLLSKQTFSVIVLKMSLTVAIITGLLIIYLSNNETIRVCVNCFGTLFC